MPHVLSTPVRVLQVTGALLFAVSLAVAGDAYLRRFDAVAAAGTPAAAAVAWNVLWFSVFALHHSLLARTPAKRWLHDRVGPGAERALYVVAASVLLLACMLLWAPLPGTWWTLVGPWRWVGRGVQLAGVIVTIVAARAIDLRELAGLEAPARVASRHDGQRGLETRGVYGLVRHPIYFGWLLMVAGAPVMTSSRLLFAAISVAYLAVAIPFEERSLVESFGEPYRAYQRQVRWRMLPGIY